MLGADTAGLWRALAQNQNHPLAGGPGGLAELLEQYAQTLAQNMKLTYLNPVALVAPNIGECGPRGPHRRAVWTLVHTRTRTCTRTHTHTHTRTHRARPSNPTLTRAIP